MVWYVHLITYRFRLVRHHQITFEHSALIFKLGLEETLAGFSFYTHIGMPQFPAFCLFGLGSGTFSFTPPQLLLTHPHPRSTLLSVPSL